MRLRGRSVAAWMADREIWPLAVGVALATFTVRWAPWGLGLLALLWLVRWLGHGRLTVCTPVDWPTCLLLLSVPVTFWATTDVAVTFVAVSRLVAGLALAYGLANWARSQARVSLLALGMAGMGLGLALFALFSVTRPSETEAPFLPGEAYEQVPILVSDTVNPNMMAGALLMALPFPLAMLFLASPDALPPVSGAVPPIVGWALDGRWFRRIWFGVAALMTAAVLVLTKSRGGWIGGGVAIGVLLARRRWGLLWLIPILLLGLVVWRGGPWALLDAVPLGGGLSSWEARVEIWSRAVYMVQDYPFTGIGAGTFGRVADTLYPFFLLGPDAGVTHAHNLWLQVAVDLGIPGLVAYAAILLLATWSALDSARRYRQAGNRGLEALAWAGLASLVGMLGHGMVDATTWIVGRGAFFPWAVMGTILALQRQIAKADG